MPTVKSPIPSTEQKYSTLAEAVCYCFKHFVSPEVFEESELRNEPRHHPKSVRVQPLWKKKKHHPCKLIWVFHTIRFRSTLQRIFLKALLKSWLKMV